MRFASHDKAVFDWTNPLVEYQIPKAADEYSGLAEYALSHHERWDR